MKLLKTESPYLETSQWRKIFLALSIMTICLYIVAMIFSLCGSKYFLLDYTNAQMDNIETWLKSHGILCLLSWAFTTLEFSIILTYILGQRPKFCFILLFYIPVAITAIFVEIPNIVYTLIPFVYYLVIPIFIKEKYWKCLIRLGISMICVFILQIMIYVIKSGEFTMQSVKLSFSANFCYALEYDIALGIILYTIWLFTHREKGDSLWAKHLGAGSSSQTSTTKSQKSLLMKNLSKTQKNKLRLLYTKVFLIQALGFLLIMVLPFILGKVLEFLVMYLAFAIVRYTLGFKYSLHFKKESMCLTVGVIVFGILTLAVPFFTVDIIIAILMGIGLAILLHLSYKYQSLYLFNKISRPDKFAELYVLMDGDLSPHHVTITCIHKGLDKEQTHIMLDFAEGNKKSYIAKKYNYSEKTIERKINEAIEIINENS